MAAGFPSPQVFSPDPSAYKPFFPCRIQQLSNASQLVHTLHSRVELLLLSGTAKFFASCNPDLLRIDTVYIMEGPQCNRRFLNRFPSFTWRRVRHSEVGGVTNASYWFGWNWTCNTQSSPFAQRRALVHMLGPAAKSFQKEVTVPMGVDRLVNAVNRDTNGVVIANGLLPVEEFGGFIICPTVFTKTKWCQRRLIVKEIADIFDQPHNVAEECTLRHIKHKNLPFVTGVANKVVQWVLRTLNLAAFSSDPAPHASIHSINNALPVITVPPDSDEKYLKAVKADDATVETWIWDERVLHFFPKVTSNQRTVNALNVLRRLGSKWWKQKVWKSFYNYLETEYGKDWRKRKDKSMETSELRKDIIVFTDCAFKARNTDWFEWNAGSTLFFWRWPKEYRQFARDGLPYWFRGKKPRSKKAQPDELDETIRLNVREKLRKVRDRGYIQKGFVKSLIRYFAVPKGESDIRMVYDGTSSGFNHWVWAPSFGLPTVESMLRAVEGRTWLGDIDIGEMFLNFPLTMIAQMYSGVDLTPYFPDELNSHARLWERWTRCLMGAKPSPYQAIRAMLWAEDVVRGDRLDERNPFRWKYVNLNLPGSSTYNPSIPWVAKMRAEGTIACDFFIYVDDVRITGSSEADIWNAIHKISSLFGYLGIQDAPRKRRPPTTKPGAWAGSMVYVSEQHIGVYIDHKKWQKTKEHLRWIKDQMDRCHDFTNFKLPRDMGIPHKELEKRRGFLVYVSRTYPSMTPYLKGIHQTLDSWRDFRDDDGWRLTMTEIKEACDNDNEMKYLYPKNAPKHVLPSTRLEDDLNCLLDIFKGEYPVVRHVRTSLILVAYYGFGDASGSGFGTSIQHKNGLKVRHGLWGRDSNKQSSNYRELCNLVEAVEEAVIDGSVQGSELFIFTDNSVAEGCFYRGTASSRRLFNLILRLRKAELRGGFRLHVIHVSGRRMVAQGTDGLSRGNFLEGVMAGTGMLEFVPLHLNAAERSDSLIKWLKTWIPKDSEMLTVDQWFTLGHGVCGGNKNDENVWIPNYDYKCKVWLPAPAAAYEAMSELVRARHMDPYTSHIFICPRLMTHQWRKSLMKTADLVFYISVGFRKYWPSDMFEPLTFGILLPFRKHPPWQLRQSEYVLGVETELREVWKDGGRDERSILRKLWS